MDLKRDTSPFGTKCQAPMTLLGEGKEKKKGEREEGKKRDEEKERKIRKEPFLLKMKDFKRVTEPT